MTPISLRPALLALAVALLVPMADATAANKLYLDMSKVPGDVTDPGYVGQIDVVGLTWQASVAIGRDQRGRRTVSQPSVQDIAWAPLGGMVSAVPLFGLGTSGKEIPEARFQIVDSTSQHKDPWMVLSAKSSVVSSWAISGNNMIEQQVTLNSAALALTANVIQPTGTVVPLTTSFDVKTGAVQGETARSPAENLQSTPARAGLYLRLGTGDHQIAGDNTSLGHEQWIAIDSYATSVSTPWTPSGSGPAAGKPSFSDLFWRQKLDATSPVVLRNLLGRANIGQATLEQVVLTSDRRAMTVMQLSLSDVIFSSFDIEATTGHDAYLGGTLTFGSYSQTNWLVGADGRRIGPFTTGYDLDRGVRIQGTLAGAVAGFGAGNLDGTEVFNPPPIPEPQTWALMLAGLAGVLVLARRQGASRQA